MQGLTCVECLNKSVGNDAADFSRNYCAACVGLNCQCEYHYNKS